MKYVDIQAVDKFQNILSSDETPQMNAIFKLNIAAEVAFEI